MYDLTGVEWINSRQARVPDIKPKEEPKLDPVVSELVGKPIRVNNPTLMKLIVKWKKEKGDSDEPDNWFADPEKVEELRKTL